MDAAIWAALTASALAACFAPPQPVRIEGWTGHAMEPFVSRDGTTLFFNSSNAPGRQTDIYWVSRIDPLRFSFRGPVPGANSSALDGVPSLSRGGDFALISPRAYGRLHATVWTGRWTGASVEGLEPQPGLTQRGPGRFTMDAEISADGRRLYLSDSRWNPFGPPTVSTLSVATRAPGGWRRDPAADGWFVRLNDPAFLQYAAATSPDERELYVTRARLMHGRPGEPGVWVATRPDADAAFSAPVPIAGLDGFVEGPSVAPDGALYVHKRVGERFVLMRAARDCR